MLCVSFTTYKTIKIYHHLILFQFIFHFIVIITLGFVESLSSSVPPWSTPIVVLVITVAPIIIGVLFGLGTLERLKNKITKKYHSPPYSCFNCIQSAQTLPSGRVY